MIAMPIAGKLTDKTGVGKIVIPGLLLLIGSTIGLTQLTGDTSYWTLSAILFVMGVGMGFAMMPLMSGAMQTLRHVQVARASTTLNIIQQVGASIGTAVMSVILTVALTDRLGGGTGSDTGLGATGANLPLEVRDSDGGRLHPHVLVGGRADRPGDPGRAAAAAHEARAAGGRRAGAGEAAPGPHARVRRARRGWRSTGQRGRRASERGVERLLEVGVDLEDRAAPRTAASARRSRP